MASFDHGNLSTAPLEVPTPYGLGMSMNADGRAVAVVDDDPAVCASTRFLLEIYAFDRRIGGSRDHDHRHIAAALSQFGGDLETVQTRHLTCGRTRYQASFEETAVQQCVAGCDPRRAGIGRNTPLFSLRINFSNFGSQPDPLHLVLDEPLLRAVVELYSYAGFYARLSARGGRSGCGPDCWKTSAGFDAHQSTVLRFISAKGSAGARSGYARRGGRE